MVKEQAHVSLEEVKFEPTLISLIKNKDYNVINNIFKPIKSVNVVLNNIYEIESPVHKDRLYFRCIKAGKLVIKFKYDNIRKRDLILFKGDGILKYEQDITEGMGECKNGTKDRN